MTQEVESKETELEKARNQLFVQLILRLSALEKLLISKNVFSDKELAEYLVNNLQELKNKLDEKN